MFKSSCRLLIEQPAKSGASDDSATGVADSYLHAQAQLITSRQVLDDAALALRELSLKTLQGSTDISGTLRQQIQVTVETTSGVIDVACNTPVAEDSAAIVNAVTDSYRTFHLQEEATGDHDNLHFLQLEKDKHDQALTRAATALVDFKSQHRNLGFEDGRGTNIVYLQLGKLTDELADAQSSSLDLKAKYAAAQARIPQAPQGDAVIAVDDTDVDITWVQSELARTNANLEALETEGVAATSPNFVEARTTQKRLLQKLAACQRSASVAQLAGIKTQLDFATRREAEIQKALDEQKTVAAALNAEVAQSTALTEQLQRAQKASDDVNARLKTVSATAQVPPEVRLLEPGRPAPASTAIEFRILSYAGVGGLLAGLSLAFCFEVFDTRLRSPQEASGILGLPVLGVIPQQRGRPTVDTLGLLSHTDPMSTVSDGVRRVRAAIFAASRSTQAKTILIASPFDDDGKSSFAANLATVMAQSGGRTLLIDTNFRSPKVQKIFDLQRSAGLSDVISGKLAVERAIRRTPVEGLEVLSSGTHLRNPDQMLNGAAFTRLIKQLSEKYQCILLDSPSVLSEPDARILGATADLTLFVVRTGSTTRKAADQSLDQLLSVGSRVLGVVVNGFSSGRPVPRLRGALRSLEVLTENSSVGSHQNSFHGDQSIIAAGNKKMRSNVNQQVDVFD